MNINELKNRLSELNADIKHLMKQTKYEAYGNIDAVSYNNSDIDERFLYNELQGVMYNLNRASDDIDYLTSEVIGEYVLTKNSGERYEDIREYTCGSTIEFCFYDSFYECERWAISSIEHNGEDYYIVGYKSVKLDGLKTRRRKEN